MSDVGSYGATTWTQQLFIFVDYMHAFVTSSYMAMDQYLLIPFLGGWTSAYQLFWCSPGVQGFDTLPYIDFLIGALFSYKKYGDFSLMFPPQVGIILLVTNSKLHLHPCKRAVNVCRRTWRSQVSGGKPSNRWRSRNGCRGRAFGLRSAVKWFPTIQCPHLPLF